MELIFFMLYMISSLFFVLSFIKLEKISKNINGILFFDLILLSCALHQLGSAVFLISDDLNIDKKIIYNLMHTLYLFVPSFLLSFSLFYANLTIKKFHLLSYIVPLISNLSMWINHSNNLFHKEIRIISNNYSYFFKFTPNYVEYVQEFSSLFLFILAFIILFNKFSSTFCEYKKQIFIISLGSVPPAIAHYLNFLNGIGIFNFSINIQSYVLIYTSIVAIISVFYFNLLSISPIIRDIIFENMPEAVVVANNNGYIIDHNENFVKFFCNECGNISQSIGNRDKIVGKKISDFLPAYNLKDKEIFFINDKIYELSIKEIKNRTNTTNNFIYIFYDITDKTKLQENLIKKEKLEALNFIIDNLVHKLNNILTEVIGNIELSKEELDCINYNYLKESVLKASNIIKSFENMSSNIQPLRKYCNLNKIITEIVESNKTENISFVSKLSEDLDNILIDPDQISLAIKNVVKNAIEAIDNNETIKAMIDKENCHKKGMIEILTYKKLIDNKDYNVVSIKNNGKVIENVSQIFDIYFTTKEFGRGLGLSVVNSIIKKHNGFVEVLNNDKGMVTFNLYFL